MRSDDLLKDGPNKLAIMAACFAIRALLVLILFLVNGCSWNFTIRDNLKAVEIRKNEPSPMSETFEQENGKEKTITRLLAPTPREHAKKEPTLAVSDERYDRTAQYVGWICLGIAAIIVAFYFLKSKKEK